MATKKFSSELSSRGTVKTTDKLIIQNIDTGATEYTTVAALFASMSLAISSGVVSLSANAYPTEGVAEKISFGAVWNRTFNIGIKSDGTVIYLQVADADGADGYPLKINPDGGNVTIGKAGSKFTVIGISEYADNDAALGAGLTAGMFYRTGDVLKICH